MADTRAGFDSMQRRHGQGAGRRGRGPVLVSRRGSVDHAARRALSNGSPRFEGHRPAPSTSPARRDHRLATDGTVVHARAGPDGDSGAVRAPRSPPPDLGKRRLATSRRLSPRHCAGHGKGLRQGDPIAAGLLRTNSGNRRPCRTHSTGSVSPTTCWPTTIRRSSTSTKCDSSIPESDRAPAAVLKIGLAFQQMGNKSEATARVSKGAQRLPVLAGGGSGPGEAPGALSGSLPSHRHELAAIRRARADPGEFRRRSPWPPGDSGPRHRSGTCKWRRGDGPHVLHPAPRRRVASGSGAGADYVRRAIGSGSWQRVSLDVLVLQHFTPAFADLTAEAFVEQFMVERLGATRVVVGHSVSFGHRAARRRGAAHGARRSIRVRGRGRRADPGRWSRRLELCRAPGHRGRRRRARADVARTAPSARWPDVERGRQHGERRSGFRTANVRVRTGTWPPDCVYAVRAQHGDRWIDGVANIGTNPHVRRRAADTRGPPLRLRGRPLR